VRWPQITRLPLTAATRSICMTWMAPRIDHSLLLSSPSAVYGWGQHAIAHVPGRPDHPQMQHMRLVPEVICDRHLLL
jgi:hypothetical protein